MAVQGLEFNRFSLTPELCDFSIVFDIYQSLWNIVTCISHCQKRLKTLFHNLNDNWFNITESHENLVPFLY